MDDNDVTLVWRHNKRDDVPNQRRLDCLLDTIVQDQIKENIKAPHHWPLWGELTIERWILRTKGQQRGKCVPYMTSSFFVNITSAGTDIGKSWFDWHSAIGLTTPITIFGVPYNSLYVSPRFTGHSVVCSKAYRNLYQCFALLRKCLQCWHCVVSSQVISRFFAQTTFDAKSVPCLDLSLNFQWHKRTIRSRLLGPDNALTTLWN